LPALSFQTTAVLEEKPVPFAVSVNVGPPAFTLVGLTELNVGITSSWEEFDTVWPSTTVMLTGPATTIRLAGTVAVNCVEFTYVVDNGEPFQSTTAPDANAVPFTVSANAGPPAFSKVELSELIVGGTPASVMLKGADEGWTKLIDVDCAGPVLADTV